MPTKTAIKKVAVVTYNRIGDGEFDNGIIERDHIQVFIAQNGHRSKWAATPGGYEGSEGREETRVRMAQRVAKEFNLKDMDHVYVYVGTSGGEEAIKQTQDISASKITYVLCDCNWGRKKDLIQNIGNGDAEVIECECGGCHTLAQVVKQLLN